MIIGIGCDIVDHDLTQLLDWQSDLVLLNRIYSKKEIKLYKTQENIEFLAGRYAGKEAVLKSLGTGMRDGISLKNIQILRSKKGKPKIKVKGKVKKISDSLGIRAWFVSISHSSSYSLAFVIAK